VDTPQAVWRGADAPALLRRMVNPLLGGASYDLEPGGARYMVLEAPAANATLPLTQPMIVLDWAQPRRE
jgi:hypothetical protein